MGVRVAKVNVNRLIRDKESVLLLVARSTTIPSHPLSYLIK